MDYSVIYGFYIGVFGTDAEADKIDISAITAQLALNDTNWLDHIDDYLRISIGNSGSYDVLQIDLDGTGGAYEFEDFIRFGWPELNGYTLDLQTLMDNGQLIV